MDEIKHKIFSFAFVYAYSIPFIYLGLFVSFYFVPSTLLVFIFAVIFAFLAIPTYFSGKEYEYLKLLSPLFCSLAIGLSIGSFFLYEHYKFMFSGAIILFAFILSVLLIYNVALKLTQHIKITLALNSLFCISISIIAILYWKSNPVFFSQILFLSILNMTMILGKFAHTESKRFPSRNLWFFISASYIFAFVIIFIIIITIICKDEFRFDFSTLA